jgi:hypothetical protein
MAFSGRGKHEGMTVGHVLPLLSTLPERFTRRCGLAPSVDRFENGLSPVGNVLGRDAPQDGCQSFCLSVQYTIGGVTCAFGGFRGENSLLTAKV